jgi:hypothetical protein
VRRAKMSQAMVRSGPKHQGISATKKAKAAAFPLPPLC